MRTGGKDAAHLHGARPMSYLTHEIIADLTEIDRKRIAIIDAVAAGLMTAADAERELSYLKSDAVHLTGILSDRR